MGCWFAPYRRRPSNGVSASARWADRRSATGLLGIERPAAGLSLIEKALRLWRTRQIAPLIARGDLEFSAARRAYVQAHPEAAGARFAKRVPLPAGTETAFAEVSTKGDLASSIKLDYAHLRLTFRDDCFWPIADFDANGSDALIQRVDGSVPAFPGKAS